MRPTKNPHYCTHCQTRFLIRDSDEPRPLLTIDSPKSDHEWRLWPVDKEPITILDVKQMAKDGCAFATHLLQKLPSGEEEFPGGVISRVPPHQGDTEPNSIVVTLNHRSHTHAFFTYMAEEESTVAHEVPQRPPNLNPASDEAFGLARKWIEDCIQRHPSCETPPGSFMPTRIIEILPVENSICIRKDVSPAPYAVLSYCWGGPQKITLTQSRVRLSHLSFATDALPPTFQDAVQVCRELGLRYFWADALCIIQDDPEDKAIEIGKMASIYQSSYVAIMASRAKSVTEGFLHPRSPFGAGNSAPAFRLPYETKDGKMGSVVLIEESGSQTYIDPLSTRAWAFQEFILSPRILDFGELRTTWVCRSEDTPTDGFASSPLSSWSRRKFHELMSPAPGAVLEAPHQIWSALVQCYMGCSLTIPFDRLPALGGIAQRFNAILNDEYLAGCWKSSIGLDLMWWQGNGNLREQTTEYLAPSWSWASIPYSEFHYISTRSCRIDEGFEMLKNDVKPVHQALRYGTVASGFIQVRGRILPDQCFQPGENPTTHCFKVPGHVPLSTSCSIIPDPKPEVFDESKRPAVAMCVCWDVKRSQIWGIVLREVESEHFLREGLFSLNASTDETSTDMSSKVSEEGHEELFRAKDRSFAAWRESLPAKTVKIF